MSYDNLSSVSQNVLKFYDQLTGEERRIPFIFDDFHFCRSRVIGLDMTENRVFTLHVCRMITCSVSQNVLKFYQQLTGEERRIPFIFDDFHLCRSRVIELDMTDNRIFTLCRMITWVVFLTMFWNFISSLAVKRGESLSFLVKTISNVLVMEIGWIDVVSGGYILVSCAHSNTSYFLFRPSSVQDGCCYWK